MAKSVCAELLRSLIMVAILATVGRGQLRADFYAKTCPNLTYIVRDVVRKAVMAEPRMAASLLRLHFHDCMVNGCDASVLLDDTDGFVGEKTAGPNNNSARGFDVIDSVKSFLEAACPDTVSCADILTLAARDAVLLTGGPFWWVPLGRRDSTTANRTAANERIPAPTDSIETLIAKFQAVGLNSSDVISLSGGHTIGRARCVTFQSRLFNFNGTGAPDETIQSDLLSELHSTCPQEGDGNSLAPLDRKSMDWFDNHYFRNLLNNSGLLQSDQLIYSGSDLPSDLKSLVVTYAGNQRAFFMDFANSMTRMSTISPLTGSDGQIRRNCRSVNQS